MKIIPMTPELFFHRQRVMSMLYEARSILKANLPWIRVRIVDFENELGPTSGRVIGRCFISKNYITISQDLREWDDNYLRHVVWHELGHAYFNAPHVPGCPLMNSNVVITDRDLLVKALKKLRSLKKSESVLDLVI